MKNYLAFYGEYYYPSGGMEDFIGDFDTIEEAIQYIEEHHKRERPDDLKWEWAWCHVYSITEQMIVY